MSITFLSLGLSALAVIIAVIALVRAASALDAKRQLEQYIGAARQTDVQVLYLKTGSGYNFTLSNRGSSVARNIDLELIDSFEPGGDPLSGNARAMLPVAQLDPAGFFQIPAQATEQSPDHLSLRLSWTNADGSRSSKTVPVNRID